MINFKEFLTEARMAPLYHATGLSSAREIVAEGGFRPLTKQWNHILLNPKPGKTSGMSLTRNPRFAKHWASVVFEFDQMMLIQKYKLTPLNYWANNSEMKGSRMGTSPGSDIKDHYGNHSNEYEEFIQTDALIPLKFVKRVYLTRIKDPELAARVQVFENELNIKGIPYEFMDIGRRFR